MSSEPEHRGFVVVTGTSTGIGAATALHLADKGFHVHAGVRSEADGDALHTQAPERLTPLIIEVTDEATISAAAAAVADVVGGRGLAGLVNNAGIAKPAPIEFQPMADFRTQLEVNLFGPVAMVQAFLPLIRRGGGRIVNVGSVGGMLVLPLNGAYSASKFGMRAISNALRLELRQWKRHVSLIEVAPVATAIFGKTFAELDGLEEVVRGAGRVGAHQDLGVRVLAHRLGQLIEGVDQHADVVGGRVGAGVARAKEAGEGLAAQVAEDWVMAVAALVGGGGALLVR